MKLHLFATLLILVAAVHAADANSSAPAGKKPVPAPMTFDARAQPLPHTYQGPFVKLSDNTILGIHKNTVIRSKDGGRTWATNDLFSAEQKRTLNLDVSAERALLLTKDGTLVLGCMNMNVQKWTWDRKIHDAPGAERPMWIMRSTDGGKTWRDVRKLHDDWTGAVRDIIQTRTGRIVITGMKMLHDPGRHAVLTYVSDDDGATWKTGGLIDLGGAGHHGGVTEPTVVELKDGRVWMVIRTNWGQFWSGYSTDGGRFFPILQPSGISTSSAPAIVKRLASGRLAMAWNRPFPEGQSSYPLRGGDNEWSEVPVSNHRGELSFALSDDDGATWTKPAVIARQPGSYVAYPYLFEITPGRLWVTTMQSSVRVQLNESDFLASAGKN